MKARALLAAGALSLGGLGGAVALIGASTSAQATGTMSCPNFTDTDVGSVDPGNTGYLVVSNVDGPDSTLSGHYTLNGVTSPFSATGVQNGQGSFHYIFQLPQGAQIVDWQVTGTPPQGALVITVSGCLNGTEVPPTTPMPGTVTPPVPGGTSVTPSGPSVAGESASRPAAGAAASPAPAVVGAARFTG